MNNVKLILALLLLSPALVRAGEFSSSSNGTSAANFLKLGVNARAEGMGGAYSAIADDASALYWNPAAMRQVKRTSITLMHASYLESSNYEYGSFVHSSGKSSFGAGVQFLSAGSISGRDQNGAQTSEFNPNDMAISLGYSHDIGSFSIGLGAKYIQSKIISTAKTQAVDIGILSPTYFHEKMRFAFTASNLGGKMKFDEKSEDLPVLLKVGSGFHLSKNFVLSADLGFPRDSNSFGAVGAEYNLPIAGEMSIAGRAGYNTRNTSDINGFSGASFGAGFNFKQMNFDYAFVPYGDLGTTHRISVGLRI